jgi:hypothetical protein
MPGGPEPRGSYVAAIHSGDTDATQTERGWQPHEYSCGTELVAFPPDCQVGSLETELRAFKTSFLISQGLRDIQTTGARTA